MNAHPNGIDLNDELNRTSGSTYKHTFHVITTRYELLNIPVMCMRLLFILNKRFIIEFYLSQVFICELKVEVDLHVVLGEELLIVRAVRAQTTQRTSVEMHFRVTPRRYISSMAWYRRLAQRSW